MIFEKNYTTGWISAFILGESFVKTQKSLSLEPENAHTFTVSKSERHYELCIFHTKP